MRTLIHDIKLYDNIVPRDCSDYIIVAKSLNDNVRYIVWFHVLLQQNGLNLILKIQVFIHS